MSKKTGKYEINSFVKVGSNFVNINLIKSKHEKFGDSMYIEGYIEWSVEGRVLMDKSHWDLIDQLWAYIVQGLESIFEGKRFSTLFPDQPLPLSFSKISSKFVKVEIGDTCHTLPVDIFYESLITGASEFWRLLPSFYSGVDLISKSELAKLSTITKKMRDAGCLS